MSEDTDLFYKFASSIVIFILNIIFSFLPFYVTSEKWTAHAEAVGGGVFLGAAVIHLFPETLHSFHNEMTGPLITLLFFCFLFVLELTLKAPKTHNHSHSRSHSFECDDDHESCELIDPKTKRTNENTHIVDQVDPSFATSNRLDSVTFLIYIMLVVHCVVESIAFGMIKSLKVIFALFCAIVGHKPVETFVLGILLLRQKLTRRKYTFLMILFSSVVPLTIVLTSFIRRMLPTSIIGVITSASAGAYLFIAFHELSELLHESSKLELHKRILQSIAFLIGAFWMGVISLFGDHEHEH